MNRIESGPHSLGDPVSFCIHKDSRPCQGEIHFVLPDSKILTIFVVDKHETIEPYAEF